MKQYYILIFIAILAILLFVFFAFTSGKPIEPAVNLQANEVMTATCVVPAIDTPMPREMNVIWSASFDAAWKSLEDLAGEPVWIGGASKTCKRLNAAPDPASYAPDEALYATAGFVGDGILSRIQHEVAEKFPELPTPQIFTDVMGSAVAYGLLKAQLQFAVPYDIKEDSFGFAGGEGQITEVRAFGIKKKNDVLGQQVRVLWVDQEIDPEYFILDICHNSPEFELIVALIPKENTLAKTVDETTKLLQETQESSTDGRVHISQQMDSLWIPNVAFHLSQSFSELKEGSFKNTSLPNQTLTHALEEIQFRLDYSGVKLVSESSMYSVRAAFPSYHFNRPFLLYMKLRDAERPFFVMWVDNAELLEIWEE